ncbi:ATP-dependent helicase [Vibrio metschnikovii]|uniref:ATP-dependent helicase n=1 Tax=Vibrio metschnikovii TaxID=28172 RepID=UPI002FC85A32
MNAHNIPSKYKEEAEELNTLGQRDVFDSTGNCAVMAGPGSGKTKTLVLKVAKIIDEDISDYERISCITYSRQCCKELHNRFKKIGLSSSENLYIGTVHSFCLSQIVAPLAHLTDSTLPTSYSVATEDQRNEAFNLAKELVGERVRYYSQSFMASYRMTHLERGPTFSTTDSNCANLIEVYEGLLKERCLVDFDDLILISRRLILEYSWIRDILKAKFPVIVIDEYQDLGKPLHDMVIALAEHGIRIIAVGDIDQSIYGFTGAHPELLEHLSERDDFEIVEMKLNYRSAQNIVSLSDGFVSQAKGIIAHHQDRVASITCHLCPEGLEQQIEQALTQALSITSITSDRSLSDIAILYPDAKTGDLVAAQASRLGIVYNRTDNNAPYRKNPLTNFIEDCASWVSYDWRATSNKILLSELISTLISFVKSDIDDIDSLVQGFVSYLWTVRGNVEESSAYSFVTELVSICFTFSAPPSHMSDDFKEVGKMTQALSNEGALQNVSLTVLGNNREKSNKLNLITYHSCKGCEYDIVIAIGLDNGVFPKLKWDQVNYQWCYPDDKEMQERRRLFFVALTRAKHDVHFYKSEFFLTSRGDRRYYGQSIFLDELASRMS